MSHIPGDDRNDDHDDDRDQHDDQHDDRHDEHLLARLRGADPAADLPPLTEDAVDDLLGSITRTPRTPRAFLSATTEVNDTDEGVGEAATTVAGTATTTAAGAGGTATGPATAPEAPSSGVGDLTEARRRRQRRRWGGAAGLGLAAAAAGVIALSSGLPGTPGSPDTTPATAVTALQAAGPVAGGPATSCAALEAAFLSSLDVAFQGRVVEVRPVAGGEVVVLEVERVYRGDVEQRVEVSTPGAGSLVDGTVSLVQGGDYLVAASEGQVAGCGATGQTSPELGALYKQAFGAGR